MKVSTALNLIGVLIVLPDDITNACAELQQIFAPELPYATFLELLDVPEPGEWPQLTLDDAPRLFLHWPSDPETLYERLVDRTQNFNASLKTWFPGERFASLVRELKAMRRTKRKVPEPQIMLPEETANGDFIWPLLRVERISDEVGDGLKANATLPVNTYIPILGKRVSRSDWEQRQEDPYILEVAENRFVDGDPSLSPGSNGVGFCGLAIYAKVNEPRYGSQANAEFVRHGYIRLAEQVSKDTEITVRYGKYYVRRGYKPGLAAKKPLTTRYPEKMEEILDELTARCEKILKNRPS